MVLVTPVGAVYICIVQTKMGKKISFIIVGYVLRLLLIMTIFVHVQGNEINLVGGYVLCLKPINADLILIPLQLATRETSQYGRKYLSCIGLFNSTTFP